MVGREVDGPLWAIVAGHRGLCGRFEVAVGASVGGLGSLSGPLRAVLGRYRGL